ncbi:MAG TPA: VOC family protein [Gemmatimonadales bacterium]|nr:VOC family protein [Gemmatimonadales bacterium]
MGSRWRSELDCARFLRTSESGWSAVAPPEQPAAGLFAMPPAMGNVPPHWLIYVAVDDRDATVAKARDLGGSVIVPPADVPTVGRFAILADPQGAVFSVIRLEQQ